MAESVDPDVDKPSHFWCAAPDCTADGRKKKKLDVYPWMKGVRFFPFPGEVKNPTERRKWLNHLRRPLAYKPKKYHRVCSRHFVDGRPTRANPYPTLYQRNNYGINTTRPSVALEKRNSHPNDVSDEDVTLADQRYPQETDMQVQHSNDGNNNAIDTDTNATQDVSLSTTCTCTSCEQIPVCNVPVPVHFVSVESNEDDATPVLVSQTFSTVDQSPVHTGTTSKDHPYTNLQRQESHTEIREVSTQTNLTGQDMDEFLRKHRTLQHKLDDKSRLHREIFVENVVKNDECVIRYTGLPSVSILNGIFNILNSNHSVKYWSGQKSASTKFYQSKGHKKPGPARKLSRYEEFILTLVRFRLGIVAFFLGDIFGISTSRVSQIFVTWMSLMSNVFTPLIKTPSRRKIKKYMPLSFKTTFPKTTAIIDCTEIYVQKPTSPTAQAQTYSTYKSSNTFKALVSITPTGAFNFISNLWGGNTSDRFITKESGFLDVIQPGDEIMADRGFTIRDLLTERHATLNIPPFTRKCKWGKGKRLNNEEIRRTKNIAHLRIHVERAIGRMKTFRLIAGIIPLKLKSVANQMLKVAAFFCNLHKPLVQ